MASDTHRRSGVSPQIRRVVTGHDANGRAVFASDAAPPRTDVFRSIPGMVSRLVWSTPGRPTVPFDGKDPTGTLSAMVPTPGQSRFLVITFPPDSVYGAPSFNPAAAAAENLRVSPGLAERFEPDGMHQTPTIDYVILLDGEIWLELDDGQALCLRPLDVVVQNGTRHAWRNRSDAPATLAVVLIGADEIKK
ncbi:MAG: cupin domain-containing protein [Pseudomonadota bacterium]